MRKVEHTIGLIAPSPWQAKLDALIRDPAARVVICVLGRKAGKTTTVQRLLKLALERTLRIGWYAHVQAGSDLAFEVLKASLPPSSIAYKNETDGILKLVNGSVFKFGTMKDPDNERGPNYDIVVLDEGAQISTYARDMVVSPMIADSPIGLVLVLTTPKGKRAKGAWVFRDFEKAKARTLGYFYLHGRTEENPSQEVREWAAWARANLPEAMIRQELDAEFLEGGLGVLDFRPIAVNGGSVDAPVRMPYHEDPRIDVGGRWAVEECSVGLDPARESDYFGCAAIGVKSRRLRGLARFNKMEWPQQVEIATDFWKRYANGRLAMLDTTGMGGDAVASMLRENGLRFRPISFSKKAELADQRFDVSNKTMIVQGLQVATQKKQWTMPWIEELISEGETFEAELLSSGHIRYQAAEGFHDDLVIAVGLAAMGLPREGYSIASGKLSRSEEKELPDYIENDMDEDDRLEAFNN